MNLSESFDQSNSHYSVDPSSVPFNGVERQQVNGLQEQLLPVAEVMQEEDVTVLRQQLETAHQLLQYRQNLVDSLTEQLVSDQTHFTQVEADLEAERLQGARQADQVDDIQAVCKDLRSQLRRQQEKISEYKQLLKQSSKLPRPEGQLAPQKGFVPLDYDSLAGASAGHSKTGAVKPLTTKEETDIAGPIAIYRKLAEMTMATTAARTQQKQVKQSRSRSIEAENYNLSGHQIELPSFT